MKWFLYAFSIFYVAMGSGLILYTESWRSIFKKFLSGNNAKLFFIPALIIGVLLIMASSASRNSWFIVVIGVIAIAKAVFLFLNPKNMTDRFLEWYLNKASNQTYRLIGIIALILGTAILSWS